jgi:hypothetical protein
MHDAMGIIESALWITFGFAPTFVAMEAAWRLAKKHSGIAVGKVA